MATVASRWLRSPFRLDGSHPSCLLPPLCDVLRFVALVQQSLGFCTLNASFSRALRALPLGCDRSNHLHISLGVSYVCFLALCFLLQFPSLQSPFLLRCDHGLSSIRIPSALGVTAITQSGGAAYAVRDSGGATAQQQMPIGFAPSYQNYEQERQQQQPPRASPSTFQDDDTYQQQPYKTEQQTTNGQQQPRPPTQQEEYQQDQYNYPSASIAQEPLKLHYEQAPTGAEIDSGAARFVPEGTRDDATVNDKYGKHQAERERQKIWDGPTQAIKLEKHSWTAPLSYETTLEQWDFAMAAVPVEQHVVLVPAVAHRVGQLWHRSPLLTANFEVQFGFGVYGEDGAAAGRQQQQPLRGKGFAFWYVYDEYGKGIPKAETDAGGASLFGYQSRPRGLGVFFKAHDKSGNPRPSISALYWENGGEGRDNAIDVLRDIPVQSDSIFFRFRNLKEPAIFKVAAGPHGVMGEIRTSNMNSWLRCFHLKDVRLRPGGFVGFTASNASGEMAAGKVDVAPEQQQQGGGIGDLMVIKFFKVWNLNPTVKGEENIDLERALGGERGELEDLLKLHSAHKDQRKLADALGKLSLVIYKYIVEHTPREEAMERRLTSLSEQLSRVEAEIVRWRAELQTAVRHRGEAAADKDANSGSAATAAAQSVHALNSVSSELYGIKSLLARHSQIHRETMESLKRKVDAARTSGHSATLPELRELANRARDIEASLAAKEQFSFLTMIGVIFILLSLALFVWKRFRDMEKKHML